MLGVAALILLAADAVGNPAVSADDAAYVKEIETWRRAREAKLRGDEGWLTVAGLFWLNEGENSFGSDAKAAVALPAHGAPARAGTFRVEKGKVTVEVAAGVTITAGGKPVTKMALRSDVPGPADVLALGPLRMFVIERSGKLAIRLRDLESPARKAFAGCKWFPVRKEYRVSGHFLPHPAPKTLQVPNVLGMVEPMVSPGLVAFRLAGQELRLEPVYESPDADEMFFIFRDKTSAHETYGAGRFFYAAKPDAKGEVIIDFNKAYTPPCGFTRYATCPLPPRQNHLPLRVEAGELNDGNH
jgi:uncharacterized protein (DUF1684 family)